MGTNESGPPWSAQVAECSRKPVAAGSGPSWPTYPTAASVSVHKVTVEPLTSLIVPDLGTDDVRRLGSSVGIGWKEGRHLTSEFIGEFVIWETVDGLRPNRQGL